VPLIDGRDRDLDESWPDILQAARKLDDRNPHGQVLTIYAAEGTSLQEIVKKLRRISPRRWDFQILRNSRIPWVLYIKKSKKSPTD